ncbi:hypothetical protein C1H46_045647 [Malus baccata]|uniref:Uncharacterized protein n=1 Tax=Malus baccata TaxID=106549 RepID=A0A540K3P2_MALBA|nr:hypothetical protein C1H46_045647 [Malus baccata]
MMKRRLRGLPWLHPLYNTAVVQITTEKYGSGCVCLAKPMILKHLNPSQDPSIYKNRSL